jgi:ABC-type sugar transport system, permease component
MAAIDSSRVRDKLKRTSVRRRVGNILGFILASVLGLLFVVPFLWMISTSLKDLSEVYAFPPRLLPEVFKWSNYADAWNAVPFNIFFLNSLIVASTTTVGVILTCSMAGYSFARLRYRGRDKIFLRISQR